MSVDPGSGLTVTAPRMATLTYIESLIIRKIRWVLKHLEFAEQQKNSIPRHSFVDGEQVYYLGSMITLRVFENPLCRRPGCVFVGTTIHVTIPYGLAQDERRSRVRTALIEWYRERAAEVFAQRAGFYARVYDLPDFKLEQREQKRIWGSCNSKHVIRINWRIIMAPISIIDYIVVHELCHLKVRDHSSRYWQFVASILPDYKERRKQLKLEGVRYTI